MGTCIDFWEVYGTCEGITQGVQQQREGGAEQHSGVLL